MSKVEHLIISNTLDYSTDLICYEFSKRQSSYLRVNRDQFKEFDIAIDLIKSEMIVNLNGKSYEISDDTLKSIYFRAPVFYRTMDKEYSLHEQLYRSQWGAFIRNLIIFDKVRWLNNPVDTYRAENKLYQLKLAQYYDLDVPKTIVSNYAPSQIKDNKKYVIKSIDTAYFRKNDQEMFTYASIIDGRDLISSDLKLAPVFIQEYIYPKIDIRATVIDDNIYAVKILDKNNNGIEYDWRKCSKEDLVYEPIALPETISTKIFSLMRNLNLNFGGVDLILSNDKYYFIEINPTGEWGWLVGCSKLPIDKAIVDFLSAKLK